MYSEREISEQRYAVAQALASARIEGYVPTESDLQDFDAFARGVMSISQFRDRSLLVAQLIASDFEYL